MIKADAIYEKELIKGKALNLFIGITFFIAATAFGAYVRIPLGFTPVPITLQTLFVLLCGATLGRRYGSLAQSGYILLGALGFPIFQGYGAGLGHILGPTGGYIIGFMACAFIVGYLVDIKRNNASFLWILFSMSTGLVFIYLFGILWLGLVLHLSFKQAVFMGVTPFIPGAVIKLAIASGLYLKISNRTNRILS